MNPTVRFASLLLACAPLQAAVDFNHQIVPLLRKHCAECHTGDKLKGGFSLNDRAELLRGGYRSAGDRNLSGLATPARISLLVILFALAASALLWLLSTVVSA